MVGRGSPQPVARRLLPRPHRERALELDLSAHWSWTYEGDLLVAHRANGSYGQTLEYDEQGRLVRRMGTFGDNSQKDRWWHYDVQGRLLEECVERDGIAHCKQTTFDESGRLVWREHCSGRDARLLLEYNAYVCH